MKWTFRHIINGLAGVSLLLLVSCQKPELYRITQTDDVFMALRPAFIGDEGMGAGTATMQAQASPKAALDKEAVRTLRVVVVSADKDDDGNETGGWTVEANEFFAYDEVVRETGELLFAIQDARRKRVYLMANCDITEIRDASGAVVQVGGQDLYKPDATSGVAPIEDCRFTWNPGDNPDWMPMTAVYDLTVPAKESLPFTAGAYRYAAGTMYVVRAVTKFSLAYTNGTAERAPVNIQVRGWGVSKVAQGPSYLLAKVHADWKDDMTFESGKNYANWMTWLADEAERTVNGVSADDYQWLTAYDLPSGTTHADYAFTYPDRDLYFIYPSGSPVSLKNLAPVYLPESKYIAGDDGEQRYELTVKTWEWRENEAYRDGHAVTYTVELPYCRSLFRNTEVRVDVTFKGDAVSLQTTVCPWEEPAPINIPPFE